MPPLAVPNRNAPVEAVFSCCASQFSSFDGAFFVVESLSGVIGAVGIRHVRRTGEHIVDDLNDAGETDRTDVLTEIEEKCGAPETDRMGVLLEIGTLVILARLIR